MRAIFAVATLIFLFGGLSFAQPNPPVLYCGDSICAEPSDEPYDLTAGGTRIPPSWVSNGTFQWPAAPLTTREVTVTTMSGLQEAVRVDGTRVIVPAAFGTQSGSLHITGNDVDVVMDNAATVVGEVSVGAIGKRNRIRWTGGNITEGPINSDGADDVLFNNVNVVTNGATNVFNGGGGTGTQGRRYAWINSTLDLINVSLSTGWNTYTEGVSPGATNNNADFIFANVKFGSTSGQVLRLQNIDNLIIVDSYISYTGNEVNGLRIHKECDNVWLADSISTKGFGNSASAGSSDPWAYAMNNATFEGWEIYGSYNALTVDNAQLNSIIRNSTSHNAAGETGTPYLGGFVDGGGNVGVAWDGSTLPDSSSFGADH